MGFSAGLFAPAWANEHEYRSDGVSNALESAMWAGQALRNEKGCDCDPGTHATIYYKDWPVTLSALESPVGSSDFFCTDFRSSVIRESEQVRTIIGVGSVLPGGLISEHVAGGLQLMATEAGLLVSLEPSKICAGDQHARRHSLRLFNFEISNFGASGMATTIDFRMLDIPEDMKISITYHDNMGGHIEHLSHRGSSLKKSFEKGSKSCLTGLSINVEGIVAKGRTHLLELHDLCIEGADACGNDTNIDRIWIESTSIGTDEFLLLCWSLNIAGQSHGLPESPTTGSVSYFIVNQDMSRRVYATQCLLGSDTHCERGKEVSFQIDGYGFTGKKVTSQTVRLQVPRDSRNRSTIEVADDDVYETEDEDEAKI